MVFNPLEAHKYILRRRKSIKQTDNFPWKGNSREYAPFYLTRFSAISGIHI